MFLVKPGLLRDFRAATALGVAVSSLVFLTPFAVNNFVQGRNLLGAGSLLIVAILAFNAWSITRGKYHPLLVLLGLVPAIIFFLSLALHRQGVIGALWCYPAVIAMYFMLPERKAWLANAILLAVTIPQAWLVLDHGLAARVAVTLFVVSAFAGISIRIITVQQRRLHEQAVTDPLTGLSNRTLLHTALEQAVAQARRSGIPMSLLSLDLDSFKAVNDELGHDAGDAVLRTMGELLRRRCRRADKAFRMGGEEFLVLLHGTDAGNARLFAEQLRQETSAHGGRPDRPVTVSIGVAGLAPDERWEDWVKRSDENLYRAKSQGRNQVVA